FERIQVDSQLEQDVLLAVPESLAAVALRNLLENALVHSPANSPVELTICLQLDAVVFKVTDQGEGISAELFEQAQQRFWRAKSANRGSGLGLAIVAAIAQRFAGTLTANKTQTNFSVALSFPILFS
ncbi:MAG: sensor histidine kinase, partial [Gammaproteobacteria bacterium]|nr:sensor histidine kinase [Gammaproteobacteria bacterium]